MKLSQKKIERIKESYSVEDLAAAIAKDFVDDGLGVSVDGPRILVHLPNGGAVFYDVSAAFEALHNAKDGDYSKFKDYVKHVEDSLGRALNPDTKQKDRSIEGFLREVERRIPKEVKEMLEDSRLVYNSGDDAVSFKGGFSIDGSLVSPCVRGFSHVYAQAINGDFEKEASDVASVFVQAIDDRPIAEHFNAVLSGGFGTVKDFLRVALVSHDTAVAARAVRREFLPGIDEIPIISFGNGEHVVKVTEHLASTWGCGSEIWDAAFGNTLAAAERGEFEIGSLIDMLAQMNGTSPESLSVGMFGDRPQPLVVSLPKSYGASVLLCKDTVEEILSRFDGPVIVSPTSVNEVIFHPLLPGDSLDMFESALQGPNSLSDPVDVLSFRPLFYDAESRTFHYAEEGDFLYDDEEYQHDER